MAIDLDKCTGCGACMVACQAENNVPPAEDASNKLRSLNWLLVYELNNKKPFPENDVAYLPRPCQQCGEQPCATVCPVIATERNEEGGIVSQIVPRCIGCRYCMAACPYNARVFNWQDPVREPGFSYGDVPARPKGVVEKCTLCVERTSKGKEPVCVEVCPAKARMFGDLDDPNSEVSKAIRERGGQQLLAEKGTKPQVYYLR